MLNKNTSQNEAKKAFYHVEAVLVQDKNENNIIGNNIDNFFNKLHAIRII